MSAGTPQITETSKSSNAFVIFGEALNASKEGLWVSLQILIIITVILATVFYFAEVSIKSPKYNYGKSLLWAFTRYIGDPGDLARVRPRTITGRLIATCIGILGILIVAVPAGILGSGFSTAIENQKIKDRITINQEKLMQFFE